MSLPTSTFVFSGTGASQPTVRMASEACIAVCNITYKLDLHQVPKIAFLGTLIMFILNTVLCYSV
jgi:hypothetical protein